MAGLAIKLSRPVTSHNSESYICQQGAFVILIDAFR
jgi:hypothetical protein